MKESGIVERDGKVFVTFLETINGKEYDVEAEFGSFNDYENSIDWIRELARQSLQDKAK